MHVIFWGDFAKKLDSVFNHYQDVLSLSHNQLNLDFIVKKRAM